MGSDPSSGSPLGEEPENLGPGCPWPSPTHLSPRLACSASSLQPRGHESSLKPSPRVLPKSHQTWERAPGSWTHSNLSSCNSRTRFFKMYYCLFVCFMVFLKPKKVGCVLITSFILRVVLRNTFCRSSSPVLASRKSSFSLCCCDNRGNTSERGKKKIINRGSPPAGTCYIAYVSKHYIFFV